MNGSGLFELRLKHFTNDLGRDIFGECCSGNEVNGQCVGQCQTRFRVCLKNYQAIIDQKSPCTFGDVMTPVLGANSMNLTESNTRAVGFTNPIRLPFEFTWPVSFFFSTFRLIEWRVKFNVFFTVAICIRYTKATLDNPARVTPCGEFKEPYIHTKYNPYT